MKQWDIFLYPFQGIGAHPAVTLSNDVICSSSRMTTVNMLLCTSLKSGREAGVCEVRLNGSDGLDWATIVRCDVIHTGLKASFGRQFGTVSPHRRAAISRRVIECFSLRPY